MGVAWFGTLPVAAQYKTPILGKVSCSNGYAAGFPCKNMDLLSFLPMKSVGIPVDAEGNPTGTLSGSWGWTDPDSGREFAISGNSIGTSFIEVTNPQQPVYLGILPIPSTAKPNAWREMKSYQHYALIVGDAAGNHGMQIFDLNNLLQVKNPPVTFQEAAHYSGVASTHEIAVNEATGVAYLVGVNGSTNSCGGGLHMVDVKNPLDPKFMGCFTETRVGRRGTGYVHDTQCVVYHGPDTRYTGKEICFDFAETAVNIADVTDKTAASSLSITNYPSLGYTHQGWLSEDHRYLYVDDELDEFSGLTSIYMRTLIFDVSNLVRPVLVNEYKVYSEAIDHNQYVRGNYLYQSNYTAGVMVYSLQDPVNPDFVASFDCVAEKNGIEFDGAWNAHPFYKSGIVVLNCMEQGLFVVKAQEHVIANETEELPHSLQTKPVFPNPFHDTATLRFELSKAQHLKIQVFDLHGRLLQVPLDGFQPAGAGQVELKATHWPAGLYLYQILGEDGAVSGKFIVGY